MMNFVVGFVIIAILAGSTAKIVVEKRKGAKCIGCPYGGSKECSCHK